MKRQKNEPTKNRIFTNWSKHTSNLIVEHSLLSFPSNNMNLLSQQLACFHEINERKTFSNIIMKELEGKLAMTSHYLEQIMGMLNTGCVDNKSRPRHLESLRLPYPLFVYVLTYQWVLLLGFLTIISNLQIQIVGINCGVNIHKKLCQ
jgi:hypothetical protein